MRSKEEILKSLYLYIKDEEEDCNQCDYSRNKNGGCIDELLKDMLEFLESYVTNDGWETAKEIIFMARDGVISKVFGELTASAVFTKYTKEEAKAKIEEYKLLTSEIVVGDIVTDTIDVRGIVIGIRDDGMLYVVFKNGSCGTFDRTRLKKTGKNMDLSEFLNGI